MKITRIIPLLALGLTISLGASAQTSFDEAVARVMSNNLDARIATARSGIEAENILAENTLESPEVEFTRQWGSTAETPDKWNLSVSQSFDWPGVYAARRRAARDARSASQLMLESTLLDLRMEARTLLIDIIHNTQLIAMQRDLVDRMDQMEIHYRKAADAGAETRLDYNKTVLERISVHRELHNLEAERETLLGSLKALNGGQDISEIIALAGDTYPITPDITPELISPETLRQRDPQYAAAKATAQSARSLASVEKRMRIPGFSVGFEHETEGDEHFNGFSIGLTLPVWGRSHQVKAATFEADASILDAEMAIARRAAEMKADYAQLATLRHILGEYEPVINDKANTELLKKALMAGQINFLTFIQETNYFIEAQRLYLDTLYDYNLLLTRLTRYK